MSALGKSYFSISEKHIQTPPQGSKRALCAAAGPSSPFSPTVGLRLSPSLTSSVASNSLSSNRRGSLYEKPADMATGQVDRNHLVKKLHVEKERAAAQKRGQSSDATPPLPPKRQAVAKVPAPRVTVIRSKAAEKGGVDKENNDKGKGPELVADDAPRVYRPIWAIAETDSALDDVRVAKEMIRKVVLPADRAHVGELSFEELSAGALQSFAVSLTHLAAMEREARVARRERSRLEAAKGESERNLDEATKRMTEISQENAELRQTITELRRSNTEQLEQAKALAIHEYKQSEEYSDAIDHGGSVYYSDGFQLCLDILAEDFPDLNFEGVAAKKPHVLGTLASPSTGEASHMHEPDGSVANGAGQTRGRPIASHLSPSVDNF